MNCVKCTGKKCRAAESCGAEIDVRDKVAENYLQEGEQKIVQAAAKLVDGGRAGTLSRLEEAAEFSKLMNYKKIGIAYCYAMEREAGMVADFFKQNGFSVVSVSCTLSGMEQREINRNSSIAAVSCNPIYQAEQLNSEGPDLTVTMGLCMGHDILFSRYLQGDSTVLVVKDRTTGHAPLEAVAAIADS